MRVNLPNHIGFTDGLKEFMLELKDGARGIAESGSQPSTLQVTGGGTRTGDFEPNFSHIEQRTWRGGRGQKSLVDDPSRFLDSQTLASWYHDKVFPGPKWYHAKGIRTAIEHVSDSVSWIALVGSNRYVSASEADAFTGADKVNLWVKRRGRPGSITLEIRSNDSGPPSATVLATAVKTMDDIPDITSNFETFDFSGTANLPANYHIVVYGGADDDIDNCWLVGADMQTSGSYVSATGALSAWSVSFPDFKINYRVTDTDVSRRFLHFYLDGALYVVRENDNDATSTIQINGDRGTATTGATSTTLPDTAKAWVVDQWAGAMVKIVDGTGKGQYREIASNTATALTVTEAWDVALGTTSRYVIYHTPHWTSVTVSVATWGSVKDVAVLNNIAYFALGQSINMARMRVIGSNHNFADDGTNKADLLYASFDNVDGPQMVRANNTTSEVSRAGVEDWGTDLTFENTVVVGSKDSLINNMIDYDNILWVIKEDGVWSVQNDVPRELNVGVSAIPGSETGYAVEVHDLFLLFSWWKSVEQLYGGTLDDIGPWVDEGLPSGQTGTISGLASILSWLFVGVDAGRSGKSSAFVYKDRGYHNIFKGYDTGHRIRGVFVQENKGTYPRLWIDYNGELIYQDYSLTPLTETDYPFQHEGVLVGSIIDMGHADTYKFFKELNAFTENLNKDGIRVEVDYQYGTDYGTDNWTNAASWFSSPTDDSQLNVGEVSSIGYRLRLQTDDAFTAPVVRSVIIKGYEVLPVKRVWSMRIKASSLRSGRRKADPGELYNWLWEATQRARRVWMYTVFPEFDGVLVRIEPPSTLWRFINRASKWTGVFNLTVREM